MASAFDFRNPIVPIRIMLGLLFIPHILFKLNDIPGSTAFFAKVGLQPAGAILWLLSDEASYASGALLDVAGGR